MSSLLHFSASMARETIKPQNNSQKLKTYSAPTAGNQFCDIEEHHIASTSRENTVSHHRLIVWQWLLYDMLHYPLGCHRETIKTMKCMTKNNDKD